MADAPKPVTVTALLKMKEQGERIVVLTCYDALFARLLDAAGVDVLLVGDSVNQILAGAETTLSATPSSRAASRWPRPCGRWWTWGFR